MLIGERLTELREEKGLGQKELGAIVGVSDRSISSYENNHSSPEDEVKLELAKYFDVSLDYLMGLTNEPFSYKRNDVVKLPKGFPIGSVPKVKDYIRLVMNDHKK